MVTVSEAPPPNGAPVVTVDDATGQVGAPIAPVATATDPDEDRLTLSWSVGLW